MQLFQIGYGGEKACRVRRAGTLQSGPMMDKFAPKYAFERFPFRKRVSAVLGMVRHKAFNGLYNVFWAYWV